jgi:hypothetical protein
MQFHIERRILERLGLREEPYLALFLKEVNDPVIDKKKFRLLLVAACLLSKHTQLIFPVSGSISRLIDEVFDDLFKKRPQMFKDFVVKSKGIVYAKDLTTREKNRILEYAAFVVTTDERILKVALNKKLPCACISQCENTTPEIIISNYEGVEDWRFNSI